MFLKSDCSSSLCQGWTRGNRSECSPGGAAPGLHSDLFPRVHPKRGASGGSQSFSKISDDSYVSCELEKGLWLRKPTHACKKPNKNAQAMKSSRPGSGVS